MLRVNLHTKVLGAFLLLALVPLGIILFSSQLSLRKAETMLRQQTAAALDEQALAALVKRSELVAAQVAAFLYEVEGDLRDLALLEVREDLYRQFQHNHSRAVLVCPGDRC